MSNIDDASAGVRVAALCGSLSSNSQTRKACKIALTGAEQAGATTRLIDLRDYELAFCNGGEDESSEPDDADRLRKDVGAAQGLILGTPLYHGSFSGVLKNAIDLMGFDEFEGKMIGLIGVAGGSIGVSNALAGLRTIGRTLHAWVVPQQCAVPEAWKHFGDDGSVDDEGIENRLREVGFQVAKFAALHSSKHFREFLELWQEAPLNPGGD